MKADAVARSTGGRDDQTTGRRRDASPRPCSFASTPSQTSPRLGLRLRRVVLAATIAAAASLLCSASLPQFIHAVFAAQESAERQDAAPAPTTNLHQWGAVTLFHGLPSDRVRAIAQDRDGSMWFGTEAGLARYDGRRTQTVSEAGLSSRRVLALRFDARNALWIGTDSGAVIREASGEFHRIAETEGKTVTAIETDESDAARAAGGVRVVLATNAGTIHDCRRQADGSLSVRTIEDRLLVGVGADSRETRAPLELTSLAFAGDSILVGTRGRGLLAIEGGEVREISSRPRSFFVEAVERDARGLVWFGAQTTPGDSGLYVDAETGADAVDAGDALLLRPSKVLGGSTGTVTSLRFDERGDLFVGTDGAGVFRYRGRTRLEHFTFEETAGGLRSDRIYSIFLDREGVVWFGTDRGVCRYDPHGLRNESLAADARSDSVRVLFQTADGRVLAGTDHGLFAREANEGSPVASRWREVGELSGKTVYAIKEDHNRMLLVGTESGLYSGLRLSRRASSTVEPASRLKEASDARGARAESSTRKESGGKGSAGDAASTGVSAAGGQEPALAGSVRAIETFQGATFIATHGRGLERLSWTDGRPRRTLVWPDGDSAEASARREVLSLHADAASGRLWIGTAGAGVFFFDGREVNTEAALDPLKANAIRAISGGEDADGGRERGGGREALWFATARGLFLYRAGRLHDVAPSVDARDVVNIRTRRATGGDATAAAVGARLAEASLNAQAWCSTAGSGLLKISIDEVFGAMITRLDAEQGLPSQNVFTVLPVAFKESRDGGTEPPLLIGTSRGVSRYEPGRAPPALRATRITGAGAHNADELSAGLRLDYPQNSLVLDVAATSSRTFPEQFQYGFLLYNHAGSIIKRKLAHEPQFQIEDLRPGDYRVEARAFNAELVSSAPLAFDLHVARAPFPWTTTALSVLLALALVALVWGAVQNARLARAGRAVMEANRQLAAARLQLANEAESERRRIARDLHDQTLADLRRLILLTDEMQTGMAGAGGGSGAPVVAGHGGHYQTGTLDPVVLRAEIESISHEIRRICEDLSPSVLENVGFVAALEWALSERVAHLPPDCKFTYEFVCEDEIEERLRLSRGVQMQIYRTVQEAVSNVCRHANATHVRLAVEVTEEDGLVLTLEDDGRGLPPENRKTKLGRGLTNIRARASLIEAEVEWRRRAEGGTVFVLKKSASKKPDPAAAV